jgi:hypothetical protein
MGYGDDHASATLRLGKTLTCRPLMGNFGPPPAETGAAADLTSHRIQHQPHHGGEPGRRRRRAPSGSRQRTLLPVRRPAGRPPRRRGPFPNLNCNGNYFALVDDLEQVTESDETNNNKRSEEAILLSSSPRGATGVVGGPVTVMPVLTDGARPGPCVGAVVRGRGRNLDLAGVAADLESVGGPAGRWSFSPSRLTSSPVSFGAFGSGWGKL